MEKFLEAKQIFHRVERVHQAAAPEGGTFCATTQTATRHVAARRQHELKRLLASLRCLGLVERVHGRKL